MTDTPHVTIYTDGGSEPNPGPGGWGAILISESRHEKELSGAAPETTNNRMELTAAIEALRALKVPCRVTLYTDSQYLRRGITEWLPGWAARGWRRKGAKPIQNVDLWQALNEEVQRHTIDWRWVKGHAGDHYNERVDRLATQARRALTGDANDTSTAHDDALDGFAPDYAIALRVSVPVSGGAGGYAFRIVDTADDTQETVSGRVDNTTSNQIVLIAARDALDMTPEGAAVRLYCPDNYVQQGMTQWIAGWERRGWTTKGGEPVKNQTEWRALVEIAGPRDVQWASRKAEDETIAADLDTLAAQSARGEM